MTTAQAKALTIGTIVRRFFSDGMWDGEITRHDGTIVEILWDWGFSDTRNVYEFSAISHSPNQKPFV